MFTSSETQHVDRLLVLRLAAVFLARKWRTSIHSTKRDGETFHNGTLPTKNTSKNEPVRKDEITKFIEESKLRTVQPTRVSSKCYNQLHDYASRIAAATKRRNCKCFESKQIDLLRICVFPPSICPHPVCTCTPGPRISLPFVCRLLYCSSIDLKYSG